MLIDIINLVLLLAGAQGIFLAIFIFHKHRRLYANRFLATLILLYSIMLLYLLSYELGYIEMHPSLIPIIIGLGYMAGPLHFLYARYLVHHKISFQKIDWLNFVPFLLYEIPQIYFAATATAKGWALGLEADTGPKRPF